MSFPAPSLCIVRHTKVRAAAYCIVAAVFVGVFAKDLAHGAFERTRSLHWIQAHGAVCMPLTDPTVRSYARWPAARLLSKADPAGYAYLQSHPVMVSIVTGDELAACEGIRPGGVVPRSSNLTGTNFILLNQTALSDPALMATGLSHELVHVRYGDPADPRARRSFMSQLWKSEEGDAHERGDRTAAILHAKNMPSQLDEELRYIHPLPFHAALAGLLLLTFGLAEVSRIRRQDDKRITGYQGMYTGGYAMRSYAPISPNWHPAIGRVSWWRSHSYIQRLALLFIGFACPPAGVFLAIKIWRGR